MLKIYSFLQGIYSYIKAVSKKIYRTCAVIGTGTAIISVIALSSSDFGGGGKSRVMAFQNHSQETVREEEEETDEDTKAKIQIDTAVKEEIQSKEMRSESIEKVKSMQEIENNLMNIQAAQTSFSVYMGNVQIEEETEEQTGVSEAYQNAAISVTEEEYNILIHIVAAEAGGCDSIGQILVANVILNRVKNKSFPNTIQGVVFQKNQFSPVLNGTLWSTKVTDQVKESVNRALAGEDYSQGALFFSARARLGDASMSWFDNNLKWLFEHDGHEFYKFRD